jgi:hypothetical protein
VYAAAQSLPGKSVRQRGAKHLELALSIIGWLMIAATVMPLVRSEFWAVRIFDFPRLQITVVFVLAFAAYVLVREDPSHADNLFLLVLSLCLAYQLWRMWPYTPLHPRQLKRVVQRDEQRGFSVLIALPNPSFKFKGLGMQGFSEISGFGLQ